MSIINEEMENMLENLKVVKRNGRKVNFDTTKVAIAIKKGFDGINRIEEDEEKYTTKDIQKIYQNVIKKIVKDYKDKDKIKIEEIQDLIEETLKKYKYEDVYTSFSQYRERRAQSRKLFSDEKKMHKFLKSLEGLGLKSALEEDAKRENANIDGNSAMGTMLQYGSTVSK
jgi:ribonucleoside-triphosphate reductase